MVKREGNHKKEEKEYDLLKCNNNGSKTHKGQTYKYSETYNPELVYPRSIQKVNREKGKNNHPTQKPVALIEYLIKTYTNEGETVLDFTAGSFTTAVACENTNRKWICIEKDENYYNIGTERVINKYLN